MAGKRSERVLALVRQSRGSDEQTWRIAVDTLNQPTLAGASFGALMLDSIGESDSRLRPMALALIENKAIRCDPQQKETVLLAYFNLLHVKGAMRGSPLDPQSGRDSVSERLSMEKRWSEDKQLNEADRAFVDRELKEGYDRPSIECLLILSTSSSLSPSDKNWALKAIEGKISRTSGEGQKFWKVVHESVKGEMEDAD